MANIGVRGVAISKAIKRKQRTSLELKATVNCQNSGSEVDILNEKGGAS